MSQPSPQASYLFDREAGDQARLIRSSETLGGFTTEACQRAGLGPGGRAIDVGCGPCGALPALAELVGSEGRVVGLDASGEALAVARTILDQLGCTNVTLVRGELDSVSVSDLCPPGPFDLAYVRRLPEDLTRKLARAGFFRIFLPAAYGGLDLTPTEAMEVYAELARADASVAWCVWNGNVNWTTAQLPKEVAHAVFADPDMILANSTRPTGQAVVVDGGYRMSG